MIEKGKIVEDGREESNKGEKEGDEIVDMDGKDVMKGIVD